VKYYFLDTSALVKNYCAEPGSRRVQDLIRTARLDPEAVTLLVCDIALAEGAAALAKKARRREDGVVPANVGRIIDRLKQDLTQQPGIFVVIEASGVMGHAMSMARQHGLTGADAVQLSAAIAARASLPFGYEFVFAATDSRLIEAARVEGFELYAPLLPAPAGGA
jgi:predicted nucleic acid-binding protein